jgi:hypothetical protein
VFVENHIENPEQAYIVWSDRENIPSALFAKHDGSSIKNIERMGIFARGMPRPAARGLGEGGVFTAA